MNKLFKMFTMINNTSGNASGIGLGLNISKKISLKLCNKNGKGL
jgi:K+-sensing histidine kinase KdpD